jgi:hypothetical protein
LCAAQGGAPTTTKNGQKIDPEPGNLFWAVSP